jgi:hypothetical protein
VYKTPNPDMKILTFDLNYRVGCSTDFPSLRWQAPEAGSLPWRAAVAGMSRNEHCAISSDGYLSNHTFAQPQSFGFAKTA